MALATGSIWEVRASATTGNVNGAGFNPANANFPTDGTVDTNTGNTASPVFSSATYNFVAGDVGAWLYVAAGTNCVPGWYQIASVASNKATLSAAIGAAVVYSSGVLMASTAVGIASVGTPSSITFGVDYSQQDTAQATATDYTAVGGSTTLTSVSAGFTRMMVGNIFHQTTTGTGAFGIVGWYEIVSFTDTSTVVLDRTPNTGTASVACTGFIGGAGRLNGLEDAYFEMLPAGAWNFIKSGTYTISATVIVVSTNATATSPITSIGYTTLRGDTCNGSNRPLLACGANGFTLGGSNIGMNISVTGTSSSLMADAVGLTWINCKSVNSSTTASRSGFNTGSGSTALIGCEGVSQNGNAVTFGTQSARIYGCYLHDSATGISGSGQSAFIVSNLIEACDSNGIIGSAATLGIYCGNTIYGREGKVSGTGLFINSASSSYNKVWSNIIYGFTTGLSVLTTKQGSNIGMFNDFFNNTTDVSNFDKGYGNLALDPAFAGATQITGSTATSAASTLTQSGGDFATVTDNVDYLHVISGTGVTTGIYLITGHTGTTLTTNNALGTSSAGDIVYYITTGHNFAVGANLAQLGFPSWGNLAFETTDGAPTVGAVQRAASGGSGGSFTFS